MGCLFCIYLKENFVFTELNSKSLKKVFSWTWSLTAVGGLNRPATRSVGLGSDLSLSEDAFAVITHSFNGDWVIVTYATLDRINNVCWFSITNFYSANLDGTLTVNIYDKG